jgi:branched-subunit amino acid ABC-type transport system permease component
VHGGDVVTAIVLNGLFVGLVYGLLALGLVVVYRGSRVINFAHGEIGMISAFVYTELRAGRHGLADHGIVVPLLVAVALGAGLAALIELVVARPLRDAPPVRAMVATFGIGSLLILYSLDRWGVSARAATPLVAGDGIRVAGLTISPSQLLILGAAAGLCAVLGVLYRYTSFGLRMRVIALDPYAAGLVGINVNRTSTAIWALAGAIAALSGILLAPTVALTPFFMTVLIVPVLAAALVGGLTSVLGAFAAGIGLGVAQSVLAFKIPTAGITEITLAGFILVMLLFRPTGLARSAY